MFVTLEANVNVHRGSQIPNVKPHLLIEMWLLELWDGVSSAFQIPSRHGQCSNWLQVLLTHLLINLHGNSKVENYSL